MTNHYDQSGHAHTHQQQQKKGSNLKRTFGLGQISKRNSSSPVIVSLVKQENIERFFSMRTKK